MATHVNPAAHPPGLIGVISGELSRYARFGAALPSIQVPLGSNISWARGVNIARNCNTLVQTMLDNPAHRWLWIIGDDHTFDGDVILQLLKHEVDLVAPLVVRRTPPYVSVCSTAPNAAGQLGVVPLSSFAPGLNAIQAVGSAGLLIRRHVLEKMPPPWFEFGRLDGENTSEDIWFCLKAVELGFRLYVDTHVQMGHMHPVVFTPRWNDDETELQVELDLDNHTLMRIRVHESASGAPTADNHVSPIDWDAWRATYDDWTYAEHRAFYRKVWAWHRDQSNVHKDLVTAFFSAIPATAAPLHVLELGGWRGELARSQLTDRIASWDNIEICDDAAARPVFTDARYHATVPDDWAWKCGLPDADVFVAAHVIEHLSTPHLIALVDALPLGIRWAYVEAPLPATGVPDWTGYGGSHKLPLAWDAVETLFAGAGFVVTARLSDESCTFERAGGA